MCVIFWYLPYGAAFDVISVLSMSVSIPVVVGSSEGEGWPFFVVSLLFVSLLSPIVVVSIVSGALSFSDSFVIEEIVGAILDFVVSSLDIVADVD